MRPIAAAPAMVIGVALTLVDPGFITAGVEVAALVIVIRRVMNAVTIAAFELVVLAPVVVVPAVFVMARLVRGGDRRDHQRADRGAGDRSPRLVAAALIAIPVRRVDDRVVTPIGRLHLDAIPVAGMPPVTMDVILAFVPADIGEPMPFQLGFATAGPSADQIL